MTYTECFTFSFYLFLLINGLARLFSESLSSGLVRLLNYYFANNQPTQAFPPVLLFHPNLLKAFHFTTQSFCSDFLGPTVFLLCYTALVFLPFRNIPGCSKARVHLFLRLVTKLYAFLCHGFSLLLLFPCLLAPEFYVPLCIIGIPQLSY